MARAPPVSGPSRFMGRVAALDGRSARFYKAGSGADAFYLPVTYHKRIRGRVRLLTLSPKLLRRVLRQP
jgi:hypothetical protein